MDVQLPIEAKDIQKLIPHRYPFLQLDRITAFEPMKTLTAIKKRDHERAAVPRPLSRPARDARRADYRSHGASVRHTRHPQRRRPQRKRFFFFAGIDDARFKRQVIPGDQLVFEVELLTNKRGIGKFNAVAKVDGQVAVEAVIMCAKRVV